ncbi:MAG: IclR family transcriptional regulator [Ideonella sp.]|nr:IclR family transcriptional regulator [Ideonella sp.]MCC7455961.1 hypothetical protein [Nitrospira sp.]
MSDYTHEGQQRILKLLGVLAGNEIDGLAPGEIARLQGCSASLVTRDLANLREAGYAEQVPHNQHWRLSPQLVQIAVRLQIALGRAEHQLAETRSRFTRG